MAVLTEQKKNFVLAWMKYRCRKDKQAQAAIDAGYSPRSASSQASQLLKMPEIQEFLKQQKEAISQDLRQEFAFDALEARNVMYDILKNPEAADRDRIAVAKDFLDRAGFKPTEDVSLTANVGNPMAGLTTEELKKLIYGG